MDKKTELNQSQEITSFNPSVPDLPSLVELDESLLDQVVGGYIEESDDCGSYIENCPGKCGVKG